MTQLNSFATVWEALFTSPVHLDSLLSKQSKNQKSILAQIIPRILLQPVSLAQELGVGVPEGEPWCLTREQLAHWRPAQQMAERLHGLMSGKLPEPEPMAEDFPPEMNEAFNVFGAQEAQKLMSALAGRPPLSLRASRKLGAQALLKALGGKTGLPEKAQCSDVSPLGVRIANYLPVMEKEEYKQGLFEIQDEGSQLMALFALWPELFAGQLQERPGPVSVACTVKDLPAPPKSLSVVDACAGAGGKTLALADAMGSSGRVFSYDISQKKLLALRRRATRWSLTNIQTKELPEGQELAALERFQGSADVVLVDAPCSGWGVLRRNPDIKWRQDAGSLKRMPEIQNRLLDVYSSLVKPGGRLVFGVCTFRKEETRDVESAFVQRRPEFALGAGGYLGPSPCDGFYMRAFQKKT